jgi:DNA-binding response OmpR family regulator
VEHEDVSREVAAVSLRSAGWRVLTARTGREALEHIDAQPPDVIISETHMPGMDGFELIRRLRGRPESAAIPVIILTEHRSPEDRMRGLELGVEDYLTKPVFMQELVTRARIALSRAQRARIETDGPNKTRFTGRLSDMSIADLVQTVDVSRKSGVIHLERDDRARGEIYVRDGKVIDAESGRHTGERALYRLLLWHDGRFTMELKTVHRKEAIDRGNQAVLLEGMRRLDEWNRLCEELPPLRSVVEVVYDRFAERLGDVPDSVNSLLRVLDGRRTVEQAVEDCDLDEVEALRALRLLCDKAMVRVIATRAAGSERRLTPPPTPVAPRVAALTTRRKTFDAPRVSLGGGGDAAAAFSAPPERPPGATAGDRPPGATTVMGHALLAPPPAEREREAPPAGAAVPIPSARPSPPPAPPGSTTPEPAARPQAPAAPRATVERVAARPPASPPAPAPRVTMERGAARPTTPAAPPDARPEAPRRPPTEPPRPGMGSPGRVRRTTPMPAPVIPFPSAVPPADAGREPSFVRSLAQIGSPSRADADRDGAERDFFSTTAPTAEQDTPLSDPDVSVVRSIGPAGGKKVFFAIAGVAGLAAVSIFAWLSIGGERSASAPVSRPSRPQPTGPALTPPPSVAGLDSPVAAPAIHAAGPAPTAAAPVDPTPPAPATVGSTSTGPTPSPAAAEGPAPSAPGTTGTAAAAGDYAALLEEANKAYRRGRGREAGKVADQALAANPAGHEAMALHASIALDAGKTRLAEEWADKALALHADSARAHAVKGAIVYEKGNADDARKHFERYLELEPAGDLAEDVRQALREM